MTEIKTDKAQSAQGLLSQGIMTNNLIFTAGFIHMDENGDMIMGTVEEMFSQVMKNIQEVLTSVGSDLDKVIKVSIFVTDISILGDLNKEYKKYFVSSPLPVREAICVKALPLGAQIEMSVVAEK